MKKRIISRVLALCMAISIVSVTALANDSTTTYNTAYKDLSAQTEIYAVTDTPGASYPNYGAKWEPANGVYYGRVFLLLPDGQLFAGVLVLPVRRRDFRWKPCVSCEFEL